MNNPKTFAKIKKEMLAFYEERKDGPPAESLSEAYGVDGAKADEMFIGFMGACASVDKVSDIPKEMLPICETMGEFLFLVGQAYLLGKEGD